MKHRETALLYLLYFVKLSIWCPDQHKHSLKMKNKVLISEFCINICWGVNWPVTSINVLCFAHRMAVSCPSGPAAAVTSRSKRLWFTPAQTPQETSSSWRWAKCWQQILNDDRSLLKGSLLWNVRTWKKKLKSDSLSIGSCWWIILRTISTQSLKSWNVF